MSCPQFQTFCSAASSVISDPLRNSKSITDKDDWLKEKEKKNVHNEPVLERAHRHVKNNKESNFQVSITRLYHVEMLCSPPNISLHST